MEALDRLQAPRLAFRPFRQGPGDGLPVRRQDQPGPGVAQFDPVAARLVDVEEERLLDRVLVGAGLDVGAGIEENVGGAQDLLTGVGGEGEMVQPAPGSGPVLGVDQVVGLVPEVVPNRLGLTVVLNDLLGAARTQQIGEEPAVRGMSLVR